MAKSKKSEQPSPEDVSLSGLQEVELIEYVNWSEGDAGLRSAMGHIVAKKEDGTFGIKMVNDPELTLIANLDRIKRHRVIHRAMGSIGRHERILRNTYTIAPKPPHVTQFFGTWLSGAVLAGSKQLAKLVAACHNVAVYGKEKHQSDWAFILDHLGRAIKAYRMACKAYIAALKIARGPLVVPAPAPRKFTLEHVCRESVAYPCPCK